MPGMELEDFFSEYLNKDDERPSSEGPSRSFDLYFECLRHCSADFFPKNQPELVEEFKNLPKLKNIFLECFKRSSKDNFERNLSEIYFQLGGRTQNYLKFYGNALLMAREFVKNWDNIIPIRDPSSLGPQSKKRKTGSLEDNRRHEDIYGRDADSRKGYRRAYESISDNESSSRGTIERRQRNIYESVNSERGYRRLEEGISGQEHDYQIEQGDNYRFRLQRRKPNIPDEDPSQKAERIKKIIFYEKVDELLELRKIHDKLYARERYHVLHGSYKSEKKSKKKDVVLQDISGKESHFRRKYREIEEEVDSWKPPKVFDQIVDFERRIEDLQEELENEIMNFPGFYGELGLLVLCRIKNYRSIYNDFQEDELNEKDEEDSCEDSSEDGEESSEELFDRHGERESSILERDTCNEIVNGVSPIDMSSEQQDNVEDRIENLQVRFNDGPVVHKIPLLNPEHREVYEENRRNYMSDISVASVTHDAIDFVTQCPGVEEENKVLITENSNNALAALPYAFNLIPAPASCSSSEWMSQSNELKLRIMEEFKEILLKFHYSRPIPRQRNLFIFDTLLKPLKTHTLMKYSEGIDLSYPVPFSILFQALQEIRKIKKNAYIIPKIYIAYGMDLAIRSIDRECCVNELEIFLNKLLKGLEEDFGDKSPPRFKNAESDEPVSPQFPIIYLITIPYCKSNVPGAIDFNDRFNKVNNFLRNFVKEKNGFKGRVMEIIDWQKIIEKEANEILAVSREMVDMRAYKLHEVLFKDQQQFLISK